MIQLSRSEYAAPIVVVTHYDIAEDLHHHNRFSGRQNSITNTIWNVQKFFRQFSNFNMQETVEHNYNFEDCTNYGRRRFSVFWCRDCENINLQDKYMCWTSGDHKVDNF